MIQIAQGTAGSITYIYAPVLMYPVYKWNMRPLTDQSNCLKLHSYDIITIMYYSSGDQHNLKVKEYLK